MKTVITVSMLFFSVMVFSGCSKPPENGKEAISLSQKSPDPEVQADYLVAQARRFFTDKKFEEAEAVTDYILKNLDKTNVAAKQILSQARLALRAKR